MCRLVATDMITRRWGRIINISSVAATKPTIGQPNYAAAKAGVEAITRCLAIEMHKRNINVNCVDGVAFLRGEVDRPDLIELIDARVRRVYGVRDVVNLLHTPGARVQ